MERVGGAEGLASHVVSPFVVECCYNCRHDAELSTPFAIYFPYRCAVSDSFDLQTVYASGLSDAQVRFCELVADAHTTIEQARKELGWSAQVYRRMRLEQPAFDVAVARAREMAQDVYVDKLPEIARDVVDVQRARLMCDNIKWTAARIRPRLYGDKVDVNLTATVDIAEALATARSRVLRPMCDPADIVDGEIVDPQGKNDVGSVDKQSLPPSLPDIFS